MVERIAEAPKGVPNDELGNVYKISADGNVYLYMKPEPFIIDTSDSQNKDFIKEEIESIVSLDKIRKVILTHLHYDHVGNLDLFLNAEVYASKEELEDFFSRPEDFFLENVSEGVLEKLRGAKDLPSKINGLKVIAVPGHTRGGVAFIDNKNKLLFSGDTLFLHGVGRTDFSNSIPEKMDDSVDKLRELVEGKGYKLCSGHDY